MGYYINGLISQLQAITKIVARPIQGATLDDAIALANFYAEYHDIDRLIHHSELDAQEDIQMLKSDVMALKEAILVFFDKLTPGWSTSSVRRISDIYLNRLHRKALRKKMQLVELQRDIDDYCTAAQLKFSQRKFNALHNRKFKVQEEAQQLNDFWRAEKKRLNKITDVKFSYVISAIIHLYRCLNNIKETLRNIEQRPDYIKHFLAKGKDSFVKVVKSKEYVSETLSNQLWEVCEKYNVFLVKAKNPAKAFFRFINLKTTKTKFIIAKRRKLYAGLIIWCICKTINPACIRKAWQDLCLKQSCISKRCYNSHIYEFKGIGFNGSEDYVTTVCNLFRAHYPDITFREEE